MKRLLLGLAVLAALTVAVDTHAQRVRAYGSGASVPAAFAPLPVPANPGDDNKVLRANAGVASWQTAAGGGGSPGGTGSELQYRSGASTFGAIPYTSKVTDGIAIAAPNDLTNHLLWQINPPNGETPFGLAFQQFDFTTYKDNVVMFGYNPLYDSTAPATPGFCIGFEQHWEQTPGVPQWEWYVEGRGAKVPARPFGASYTYGAVSPFLSTSINGSRIVFGNNASQAQIQIFGDETDGALPLIRFFDPAGTATAGKSLFTFYKSTLDAGQELSWSWGQSSGTNDAAYQNFHFTGAESASNYMGWGFPGGGYQTKLYASGLFESLKYSSTIATGTAPYACTSTTLNTNLNADQVDSKHATDFTLAYVTGNGATTTAASTFTASAVGVTPLTAMGTAGQTASIFKVGPYAGTSTVGIAGPAATMQLVNTNTSGATLHFFAGTTGVGFGTDASQQAILINTTAPSNTLSLTSGGLLVGAENKIYPPSGTNLLIQSEGAYTNGKYVALQAVGNPGSAAYQDVLRAVNNSSGNANLILVPNGGNASIQTPNGALWTMGQASELITLSTTGTTTDSSANLLPANSIIEAVVARVTTTITTAMDWSLGDATTAGRFSTANSTMTAGTTQVGLVHQQGSIATDAAGPVQASAAKVRITTTGTPGAGSIRVTVFYRSFTPPSS